MSAIHRLVAKHTVNGEILAGGEALLRHRQTGIREVAKLELLQPAALRMKDPL